MARPDPSIFSEHDAEAAAQSLAVAEADVAAGRVIPHEDVVKWLESWGTPNEAPPPAHWGLDG